MSSGSRREWPKYLIIVEEVIRIFRSNQDVSIFFPLIDSMESLTETSGDVIFGFLEARACENLLGAVHFDEFP